MRTVFTISPTRPFVDALAEGLLAEACAHPTGLERLADYLVLLPTRRACTALGEAFLRASGGQALLLPRLQPIGDIDEEDLMLAAAGNAAAARADLLDLPPAIDPLRRRFLLARLIRNMPDIGGTRETPSPDRALMLADELGRLLDQVQTEGLSLEAVEKLVPELYADHWRVTVEFLDILKTHWPILLDAIGAIDPAARRDRLIRAQAEAWMETPPDFPVVAAGSTGSIPATADLLATVAGLPAGRVVLPGLDRYLSEEDWHAVLEAPTHPQHGLARLIARLGLDRATVADWPETEAGTEPGGHARARLVAEALRPAETTGAWMTAGDIPAEAVTGVDWLEAPNAAAEAGAIALALRETLETDGRTAALVTPDRTLARRVAAAMERWGIAVDDSAGRPLSNTPAGIFLRLVGEAALTGLAPVALLALLKHPLAGLGLAPAALRRDIRRLEIAVLRGPKPGPGAAGLHAALDAADVAAGAEGDRLTALVERIEAALGPLMAALSPGGEAPPTMQAASLIETHIAAAEAVAATETEEGAARLWRGEDGEALGELLAGALDAAGADHALEAIAGGDYPAVLEALMIGVNVRPRHGRHPRVFIWGPLEARLQHADLIVLGGLNEGTWPMEPEADPWMSRPMRRDFGLPAQERRIGLAAHDFAQAFAAPRLLLTRASKIDGQPTVPSRWLERLAVVLARAGLSDRLAPNRGWAGRLVDWERALHAESTRRFLEPPAPRPPVAARPRALSVTRVETWLRDPYSIFAERILGLRRLDDIDADFGAAERGSFIHRALELFVERAPPDRPLPSEEEALSLLLRCGEEAFGPHALDRPEVHAFWWPRYERIARWFLAREIERRETQGLVASATEIKGRHVIDGPAGPFTLSATADRIDLLHGGGYAIIDYKTGTPPSARDLKAGYAPQLPLEAAMAMEGAFPDLPPAAVVELAYWRLSGGDPPGEVKTPNVDIGQIAPEALDGLHRLVARFDDPARAYTALPRPARAPRFNDYAHLARVAEWARADLGGGEG
ncbi:double-strand break repair protein AddB [Marivibrio halodurans]|uniref:Double-strand break repair protein AddB n=1 Tax=Marivibrio halodurans TaxID=2039722 RepID=A0A8J7SPK4_9PROT|nr:double-strand break repair protein AddB [Marivibrio halodurans]MBP5858693.1 double-strand break repair protein AddB [Marivibrio halodurans]